MWPLVVVFRTEHIEPSLLAAPRSGRWSGRAGLQFAVKLLMGPVLLEMPDGNPLRHDAQADPPDGQPRQPPHAGARKRRPVIAADPRRQAVLRKRALEPWPCGRIGGPGEGVTPQHIPTEPVPQ